MTSDFPPDVLAFVARVARLTRLRKHERTDIERELLSHFREALASGRTPDAAIAAFGDPKVAAASLRAGAVAKRTVLDRMLGKAALFTSVAALLAFVAYASITAYLLTQDPVRRTDTVAALQSTLPKSSGPDDSAWPIYRSALLQLECAHNAPSSEAREALKAMPWPGDEQWPMVAEWLQTHDEGIRMLHTARAKPSLGFPIGAPRDALNAQVLGSPWNGFSSATDDFSKVLPMLALELPHLAKIRAAVQILCCDAIRAVDRDDGARFVTDMQTVVAMSKHAQEGRLLICDLVGFSIRSMARTYTSAALEWKPELLNSAQLADLQMAFESVPDELQKFVATGERLMWEDILQALFTDGGDGNGVFLMNEDSGRVLLKMFEAMEPKQGASAERGTAEVLAALPRALSAPMAAWSFADRKSTNAFIERLFVAAENASQLPLTDYLKVRTMDRAFEREVQDAPLRWTLPRLLTPTTVGRAMAGYAVDRAQCDSVAVTCAALRFLRDTGRWPATADELVPSYLASIPTDPWTGSAIQLGSGAAGNRIWSVGWDGHDNGGDPLAKDGLEWALGGDAPAATTQPIRNPGYNKDDYTPTTDIDWVWYAPVGSVKRWRATQAPRTQVRSTP